MRRQTESDEVVNPYREPAVCERCQGRKKVEEWDGMGGWDLVRCPTCGGDVDEDGDSEKRNERLMKEIAESAPDANS